MTDVEIEAFTIHFEVCNSCVTHLRCGPRLFVERVT